MFVRLIRDVISVFQDKLTVAEKKHLEVIKSLIKKKSNLDLCDRDNQTQLCLAVQNKHVKVVKELLLANANLNLVDEDSGYTPLAIAAEQGHVDIVNLLIAAKAKVETPNKTGKTALYHAAKNNHVQIVKILLQEKANPNSSPSLYIAAQQGHLDTVQILLEKSVDVDQMYEGVSALCLATQLGRLEVVKALLEAKANLTLPYSDGSTPLMMAVSKGFTEVIKVLLETRANPNGIHHSNNSDITPLHLAIKRKNQSSFNLLLEYKADPNQKVNGQSALCLASSLGNIEVVNTLLALGVNKSRLACDSTCWSPLKEAVYNGHLDIVKKLLDADADINLTSDMSETALFLAAEKGHIEIVKELLKRKADLNRIIKKGYTALAVATQNGHDDIVKILLETKADPNLGEYDDIKPLSIAVHKKNIHLVNLFLEYKTDPNLRVIQKESHDQYISKSLIGYAEENNLAEIAKVLAKANASHIPKGQEFLSDKIAKEIQSKDDKKRYGFCAGVSFTAMPYFFKKKMHRFDQLTNGAAKIKKGDFNNQFNDLITNQLILIKKAKIEICEELEREFGLKINPDEIWKFTTQIDQYPLVCNLLNKENINLFPNSIDHLDKLTKKQNEILNNTLRSIMSKKLQAKMALEEKCMDDRLEIRAFLESIEYFQNIDKYNDLYEKKEVHIRQDSQLLLPLLIPKKFAEEGLAISQMDRFRGAYTKGGLYSYFDSLKTVIDEISSSVCFALSLRSSNHRIMVGYDSSHSPPWVLIDANELPTRYLDNSNIHDEVLNALSDNEKSAFCTEIYGCESDKQEIMRIMDAWKKTHFWKKNHILSEKQGQAKIVDSFGGSLLFMACGYRDLAMIKELIELKADVNQGLSHLKKPLHIAVEVYQDLHMTNALLTAGADPNTKTDGKGSTLLERAVNNGDTEIVKSLLQFKASSESKSGNTSALLLAVTKGNLEMVDALLNASADISVTMQTTGDTLLNIASQLNYHEIVKRLLKSGANPNKTNLNTVSPLHSAVYQENIPLMVTLLEEKADPECQFMNKYNSMDIAIGKKNRQAARTLVAYGAAVSSSQITNAEKMEDNLPIIELLKYVEKCYGNPLREKALRHCCAFDLKSEDEFDMRFSEFKMIDLMVEKLHLQDATHQFTEEINQAYQDYAQNKKNAQTILLNLQQIAIARFCDNESTSIKNDSFPFWLKASVAVGVVCGGIATGIALYKKIKR